MNIHLAVNYEPSSEGGESERKERRGEGERTGEKATGDEGEEEESLPAEGLNSLAYH